MRMDADGGVEIVVTVGEFDGSLRVLKARPDGYPGGDACRFTAIENGVNIGIQRLERKMAVRINQLHFLESLGFRVCGHYSEVSCGGSKLPSFFCHQFFQYST